MRNDKILYTGVGSGITRKLAENKLENKEERSAKRAKMLPSAEVVMELIKTEKANIVNIDSFVMGLDTSVEDIKSHLLARKLYSGYLTELSNKLQNILRENKHEV